MSTRTWLASLWIVTERLAGAALAQPCHTSVLSVHHVQCADDAFYSMTGGRVCAGKHQLEHRAQNFAATTPGSLSDNQYTFRLDSQYLHSIVPHTKWNSSGCKFDSWPPLRLVNHLSISPSQPAQLSLEAFYPQWDGKWAPAKVQWRSVTGD